MKFNLPVNVNEREKKFILIGGVVLVFIILYQLYSWYGVTRSDVQDYTDARLERVEKELTRLAEKPMLEKRAQMIANELKNRERGLLQAEKAPVAAAMLQKLLKDMAASLKIEVNLERALNPVEAEMYSGIPVEIGFTATTTELKDLLLRLQKGNMLLTVAEMKVRVTNTRDPKEIHTTLIVMGFIKKPAEKQEEKEDTTNVT